MQSDAIKHFVIIGGGTAGWLAAATLANIFKQTEVQITLIESDTIGIVGVGEATIPPLLDSIRALGIDEAEFIKATQATFKWGIKFEDWYQTGQSYFHPFGSLGKRIDGHEFYQCWLKSRAEGDPTPLMAHSPEAVLAEHNRFFLPFKAINTPLASARYALHLDSTLVGQYLRQFSENLGVTRIEGLVEKVIKTAGGDIASVRLQSGQVVNGDFFIDCSGFRGLLIEESLQSGYDDWSGYLPCNRAVTVQTDNVGEPSPYTVATAKDAGWTWRIPLQHRTGNGYVFCDKYCSDDQAINTLLGSIEGEPLNTPRVIPFVTGMRKHPWKNNCLALGLAQGFLEPLESTAIHLVSKTLALFVRLFPDRHCNELLRNEFNRRVQADYEEIRDFLILHYCTTQRNDTDFWQYCRNMTIPDSLQQKLDLFKVAGGLIPADEALFQPTSWYAVYTGMGIIPDSYNPTVDALHYPTLKRSLDSGRQAIFNIVQQQPHHQAFIDQYCRAMKPG
ncbi:tryptophan halogenase family protein [Neptunicella sp. SCSIO 80796]|uniref:tryptophan halogenase family protein n=1 Tax=Neptunicella plasticusilytica TaxID=3117012 RepID=UPI003A4D6BB7